MRTKRTTEITVETHRILVIRERHRLDEGWCEHCGNRTARISLQAATEASMRPEAIFRHVDAGRLHFTGPKDDRSFICLATSTNQERNLLR